MNNYEVAFRLAELEKRMANMIRLATVETVDVATARCTVSMGDIVTTYLPWLTQRAGADRTWWAPTSGEQVLVMAPSGDLTCAVVLPAAYQTAHMAPSNLPNVHHVEYSDGTTIKYDRASGKMNVDCVGDVEVTAVRHITANAGTSIEATAGTEIKANAGTSIKAVAGTSVEATAGTNIKATAVANIEATAGGNLSATVVGNVVATAGGTLTATVTGTASVTAAIINLTAPIINITGVVNILGLTTVTGDVIATGKSLMTHTHLYSAGPVPGVATAPPT